MKKIFQAGKGGSGFTLVEIMIAIAITGIIMSALVAVFASQHSTYIQQTEAAKDQASARGALHRLAGDIRMAGYTSVPFGIGALSTESQAYALITLRDGATVIPKPSESNSIGSALPAGGGDAIEIWGNFRRERTHLKTDISIGDAQVQVLDSGTVSGPEVFQAIGVETPGFIIVGDNQRNVEMFQLKATDSNPVELKNPGPGFQHGFQAGDNSQNFVAPVHHRVYFVHPKGRTSEVGVDIPVLFMRNCLDYDCSNYSDVTVAEGVDRLELLYNVAPPSGTGNITRNQHMVCDPCTIRSVRIRIRVVSTEEREIPVRHDYSTTVRVRNLGLETFSCSISGCTGTYDY